MTNNLIEACQQIIRIPGESGEEKNVALFLMKLMKELNYDNVWIDEWGNVIGEIIGEGSYNLLFQGHMDTVGVEDEISWKYPPFGGIIQNGRLYGRGSSDMKSALVAMIFAGSKYISKKSDLKGNLFISGVVNEEIFEGEAQGKVLDQVHPDLVILGESSDLKLCIGQKGRAEIKIITHGKSAHSANPDKGINAVNNMFKLIKAMETIELPEQDFLGKAILELTDIISYPYPGRSIIPNQCHATFDRRLIAGENENDVIDPIYNEIKKLSSKDSTFDAEATIVETEDKCYTGKILSAKRFFPGWFFKKENDFVQIARKALKENGFSDHISFYSFCTDGSQSAGIRKIPTIGFGPSSEKIAHIKDEYIEISQLESAYRGYNVLIEAFLSANQ